MKYFDVTFNADWMFHPTQDICITFANLLERKA